MKNRAIIRRQCVLQHLPRNTHKQDQEPVEYIVNYLGQTLDAQLCGQLDLKR